MEAFKVPSQLAALLNSYPDAIKLMEVASTGGEQSKIAIARLWLSEGIPYAFRDRPGIYESIRTWLGVRLDVNPKEVSLTGSARIGQSLAPKKLGATFGKHSDLDLFIVSNSLFEKMKRDFNEWSYQFEGSIVHPANDRERLFWVDNNQRGLRLIQRGFLDSFMVPNRDVYPTIKNISQTMWLLKEKLQVTEGAPEIKKASIRCYRDWDSFVRQTVISLSDI